MSRKNAQYDEDDYWDEEGDYDYEDDDGDYYDEYDDVPKQKPASPAKPGNKGGGKGKAQAQQAAPAGASTLAHYLCDPPPPLLNGRPQKGSKKPAAVPAAGKGAPSAQKGFQFDTPSPDDAVSAAQSGRKISSSQGAAGTESSAAPPVEGVEGLKVSDKTPPETSIATRDLSEYAMEESLKAACEKVARAEDAQAGGRKGLHLVVLGHVDAGKSTLMGRLLHDLGVVDQRTVHKCEKEAAQAGKASFSWAWLLDERPEERMRGVTVDVATSAFQTPAFNVTLLDAPGHRDFIPNMIAGAAQADAALLLVDGSPGGFESGFEGNGQTREHAQLARSLGVDQLAVVVSKLDMCGFSAERFGQIKDLLGPYLKSCGFKDAAIQWLPAVGPSGENLVNAPTNPQLASWWTGSTLVQAIDTFSPPERNISRPLRMPVSEVVKSRSLGGDGVSCKVEAGAIMPGMQVMVQPGRQVGTVKAVEVGGKAAEVARAGDSASIGITGIDPQVFLNGISVVCHPGWPCPVVTKLEAKVVILDIDFPMVSGQPATLHVHVSKEEASISRLVALLEPKTGEVKKSKPRCLLKGHTAVVEVELSRGLCMEVYSDFRALGRVTLRDGGKTLAVGIVQKIIA